MKRGKKYTEAAKLVDRATQYDVAEAISLVKKTAVAKFDETVEAHIRLGVDGRHADQQVRGAVVLPHGTGKFVFLYSLKVIKWQKQKQQVQISLVAKNSFQESRMRDGSILTLQQQHLT